MKTGFDCEIYEKLQSQAIIDRSMEYQNDILYIEVGGKIIDDFHSVRTLPGYRKDLKLEIINKTLPYAEFICVISAKDIERQRYRDDFNIGYEDEFFRLIDGLKDKKQKLNKIVINRIDKDNISNCLIEFEKKVKDKGLEVYRFYECLNYKPDENLVTELDNSPFIKLNSKQVVVIAPGAGSGKFRICLNQLYHEMKNGKKPLYIKIETFPVHNMDPKHILNLAYVAATADFGDTILLDNNKSKSTSYNRDLQNFELLKYISSIFKNGESDCLKKYDSATSMGINYIKSGIIDDLLVQKESAAEIMRRFFRYYNEYLEGNEKLETVLSTKNLINEITNVVF